MTLYIIKYICSVGFRYPHNSVILDCVFGKYIHKCIEYKERFEYVYIIHILIYIYIFKIYNTPLIIKENY